MRKTSGLLVLVGLVALAWAGLNPQLRPVVAAPGATSPQSRVYLPVASRSVATEVNPPAPPSETAAPEWLAYLNYYRATAGLPPVTENPAWSQGCLNHARYIVLNRFATHAEDPANPWYTPDGDRCGRNGNVVLGGTSAPADRFAIDSWMQAPFHALGIIDPLLAQVGYGSYRNPANTLTGATLDIIRGRSYELAGSAPYPVKWPGDGAVVPLDRYRGDELPDPLTACPGYSAPTGLPVVVQLGAGTVVPQVSGSYFAANGVPLEHCVFDQTSYTNPNPAFQSLARAVLAARSAVILIPRAPLQAGVTYTVAIAANGQTHTWSFAVSGGQ